MQRITINGLLYDAPYAKLFRRHTDAEYNGLRADIAAHGVWAPVITGVTPTHGRIVIDGLTRAGIALELEVEVPIIDVGDITDAEAESRSRALNVHRRHLSSIERDRLIELAAQGKTQQAIADEFGVTQSAVSLALAKLKQVSDDTHNFEDYDDEDDDFDEDELEDEPEPDDEDAPVLRGEMPDGLALAAGRYELGRAKDALRKLEKSLTGVLESPLGKSLRGIFRKSGQPIDGHTIPQLASLRTNLDKVDAAHRARAV